MQGPSYCPQFSLLTRAGELLIVIQTVFLNTKVTPAERTALSAAMQQLISRVKAGLAGLNRPTAERAAPSVAMQQCRYVRFCRFCELVSLYNLRCSFTCLSILATSLTYRSPLDCTTRTILRNLLRQERCRAVQSRFSESRPFKFPFILSQ